MKDKEIIKKQAAEQAPVPPPKWMRSIVDESTKPPEMEPGEERDKMMAEFAASDAWKELKRYMHAKQMMLAKQTREHVEKSDNLEAIGFRFMMVDQVNKFAQEIITHVENVSEVMKMKKEADERPTTDK